MIVYYSILHQACIPHQAYMYGSKMSGSFEVPLFMTNTGLWFTSSIWVCYCSVGGWFLGGGGYMGKKPKGLSLCPHINFQQPYYLNKKWYPILFIEFAIESRPRTLTLPHRAHVRHVSFSGLIQLGFGRIFARSLNINLTFHIIYSWFTTLKYLKLPYISIWIGTLN